MQVPKKKKKKIRFKIVFVNALVTYGATRKTERIMSVCEQWLMGPVLLFLIFLDSAYRSNNYLDSIGR